jgi:polar amino acid transport system substrate-binding protein
MSKVQSTDIAPQGTLRVGIATAPVASVFFCKPDESSGEPRGVPVDLGAELARALGVPLALVVYPNSGELTAAGPKGEWDIAFMPVDAERRKVVDFGAAYYLFDSTFLIAPGSSVRNMAELDSTGKRAGGIAGTTTVRSARRALKNAEIVELRSVDEMLGKLRGGEIEAIALDRETLKGIAAGMPGAHVLKEHFHETGIAVAVPKGHSAALAWASEAVERAKASGAVQRAFARAGMKQAVVAPAGAVV